MFIKKSNLCLGTFIVNAIPALVVFNTGASQFFVPHSFCKNFDQALGELDSLLTKEIVNDKFR